jgi:hypothetical protein
MPGYRRLTAAAHNILHAMASGLAHDGDGYFAEHLARAAARAGAPEIRLDLLAGTVTPPEAATPALARYAELGRRWWPETAAGVGADLAQVRGAEVRATFEPGHRGAGGSGPGGEAARVAELTAVVTDDRGVAHVGAPPRSQLHLAP